MSHFYNQPPGVVFLIKSHRHPGKQDWHPPKSYELSRVGKMYDQNVCSSKQNTGYLTKG